MEKICENLMNLFTKLSHLSINLYILFWTSIGYKMAPDKQAESFIVTEDGIEILSLNRETDKENLLNYLKHHIMYTDDKFNKMYFFDEPLIVRFKYQNEIYQICLNRLESKNTDHSVIMKEPKYLSAVVKLEDVEEEDVYITEKIVEFHGPNRNFFKHIPDSVSSFSVIFKDYKGKLHTFDMMGKEEIYLLR